jgi:hypothetical protein
MSEALSEKKVLKKLGIKDFRHLTKEKFLEMASMLDKMDPEVAKKALDQFPEFSTVAKEVLAKQKATLEKGLEENSKSVKKYYDSCNTIIKSLQKQLENENLSFEEKKYFIDRMMEIEKRMGEKDKENKGFLFAMGSLGAAAVVLVVKTAAAALGVKINKI